MLQALIGFRLITAIVISFIDLFRSLSIQNGFNERATEQTPLVYIVLS